MNISLRHCIRLFAIAALLLSCRQPPLAAAEPADDPVGRDLAAFDAEFSEMRLLGRAKLSALERAQAYERSGLRLRELALDFLAKHPHDPRRWEIVYRLFPGFPRFAKDWGPLDEDGSPLTPIVDEAAALAWQKKVAALRAEMAQAPDLPEAIRKKLADDEAERAPAEARRKELVQKARSGRPAPDFAMTDLDGRTVSLADFKGKVVVLDFWATWCAPCKAAMPHTQEVAAKYREQGVIVLASCTSDTRPNFDKWIRANAARYPDIRWAFDPLEKSPERAAAKLYEVPAIPAQFVIDRAGRIVDVVIGFSAGEPQLEKALARAGIQVEHTPAGP